MPQHATNQPQDERATAAPPAWWEAAALGIVALVVLPLRVQRAAWESSLWVDEVFTLSLARRTLSEITALTTVDAHPPGYYLMVKGWWMALEALGVPDGLLALRMLSVLWWGALLGVGWVVGRRCLGGAGGTLMVLALAFSAPVAFMARDLRNYIAVCTLLLACFGLLAEARRGGRTLPAQGVLWGAWALCAMGALWMHLLAAPLLFVLGLLFLVWARGAGWSFLLLGGIAHGAAALSFLPWLHTLAHQMKYLALTVTDWMTPATALNLLRVFVVWWPLGEVEITGWTWLPGAAGLAVPGLLWLAAARRSERPAEAGLPGAWQAAGLVAVAFVGVLWAVSALGLAKVFHGPRYPMLAAPLGTLALVGLALEATRRRGWSNAAAVAVLLPWLAAGILGEAEGRGREATVALGNGLRVQPPPLERDVFISPAWLIPFVDDAAPGFRLRPVEELPSRVDTSETLQLLRLHCWRQLREGPESVLDSLLGQGLVAEEIEALTLPQWCSVGPQPFTRLRGLRPAAAARILHPPPDRPVPADAIAAARAEDQLVTEGFSMLELDGDLRTYRWGSEERMRLRFDRPVPRGRYVLRVRGFRLPYPTPVLQTRLRARRESQRVAIEIPAGEFTLAVPLRLRADHDPLLVDVLLPTWQPSEFIEGSEDHRLLTIIFSDAWLEQPPAEENSTSKGS